MRNDGNDQRAQPERNIHCGTVEVSAAYQHFSLPTDAARLRSTIIDVPHKDGFKRVLVVYLVGVFGDTRAGFVYNTIGRALDFKHNQNREVERSKTHIDDGLVVDEESKVEQPI